MSVTVVRLPSPPATPRRAISSSLVLAEAASTTTETDATYPGSTTFPGSVTPGTTTTQTTGDTTVVVGTGSSAASSAPTATVYGGWGMSTWTRQAWAGDSAHNDSATGGILPPTSAVSYFWTQSAVGGPWAVGAWGGALTVQPVSGGLTINPDPASGTVAVQCWWADATYLQLVRTDAITGETTPVRAFSPFVVDGDTRHNSAVNPTCAISTAGYASLTGNPLLTQLTGAYDVPSPSVSTALRITAQASGTLAVQLPEQAPGEDSTRGFWLRAGRVPATLGVQTQWADTSGMSLGTVLNAATDNARTQTFRQWSWVTVTSPAPSATGIGVASLVLTGVQAGDTFDFTGLLWQPGDELDGGFFDGSYTQGGWNGTPGLSTSRLAPPQYVVDGEAPLDVPVTYSLTNPGLPGYTVNSQQVILEKVNDLWTWASHPARPGAPFKLWVQSVPKLTRPIDQGVYAVIGREHPVVKSGTVRRGATGAMTVITEGQDDAARWQATLSDGQPILVRAPASYGTPGNWWLAFADVEEDVIDQNAPAQSPLRLWAGNITEVDPPADFVSAGAGLPSSPNQQVTTLLHPPAPQMDAALVEIDPESEAYASLSTLGYTPDANGVIYVPQYVVDKVIS